MMPANENITNLLEESLWHLDWSLRFGVAAMIAETIALMEVVDDNSLAALEVLGCGVLLGVISYRLLVQSRRCKRKAGEVRE